MGKANGGGASAKSPASGQKQQQQPKASGKSGKAMAAGSNGAQFNNCIAGLDAENYKFKFSAFGSAVEIPIKQFPAMGIPGVLWDCEYVLAVYVARQSARWNTTSVVELGCGTGLAAAVAWKLGAFAVATDLPEVVESVTAPNVTLIAGDALKKRRNAFVAAPLSWGVGEEGRACEELCAKAKQQGLVGTAKGGECFDFVIAADVVYHSDAHGPLMATLAQIVKPSTTFVFAHRRRLENDTNFLDLVLGHFKTIKATPVTEILPDCPLDLTMYEFTTHDSTVAVRGPAGASNGGKKKAAVAATK
jgi:predicted nicotinamide N-methyase